MTDTPYADRDTAGRLRIIDTCTAAGSHFYKRTTRGFRVAIGRGKYSATVAALGSLGFTCNQLVTFPLGTDKPAEHLRHDSHNAPACCWMFADFEELKS